MLGLAGFFTFYEKLGSKLSGAIQQYTQTFANHLQRKKHRHSKCDDAAHCLIKLRLPNTYSFFRRQIHFVFLSYLKGLIEVFNVFYLNIGS